IKGEAGLNELREKARAIAEKLNLKKEFEKLNKLISALLNTKPSKVLSSPLAIARSFGNPYYPARLPLFEKLFIELKQKEFKDLLEKNTTK
ncbi:MAG: cell filamentation protein Fic, partial [Bacteroidota bacterium]|nr:cell filamentation protein Fic [Bacteroidota bacterium]